MFSQAFTPSIGAAGNKWIWPLGYVIPSNFHDPNDPELINITPESGVLAIGEKTAINATPNNYVVDGTTQLNLMTATFENSVIDITSDKAIIQWLA